MPHSSLMIFYHFPSTVSAASTNVDRSTIVYYVLISSSFLSNQSPSPCLLSRIALFGGNLTASEDGGHLAMATGDAAACCSSAGDLTPICSSVLHSSLSSSYLSLTLHVSVDGLLAGLGIYSPLAGAEGVRGCANDAGDQMTAVRFAC